MGVTLYPTIAGMPWEEAMAHQTEVQWAIDTVLAEASADAQKNLAAHHYSGNARILTERGDVDGYLILDDERGLAAAMSIEYGRGPGDEPGDPFPNGTAPTWILHNAVGLAGKRVRPNSRRKKKYIAPERYRT